jgi:hypothetical protein
MKISRRLLQVSSGLSLLIASCIGCSVKQSEAPGIYVTDDATIEVKQNGTFQIETHGGPKDPLDIGA